MRYVYLGGPITGLEFDEAVKWRNELKELPWPEGWTWLDPMREKEQFRMDGPLPSTFDAGSDAVRQDLDDIDQCEIVLMNLAGARTASIGTMAEMGYAYHQGKYIIAVLPERERAQRDARGLQLERPINPHDHIFVWEMARYVSDSIEDAFAEFLTYTQFVRV